MQPIFINISTGELLIVFLVVMLLFGPKKLPEIVRFLGKLFNDIKHASEEVKREISQVSSGIPDEIKKTGEQVRKDLENAGSTMLDAVPRASILSFEKAVPQDSTSPNLRNPNLSTDTPMDSTRNKTSDTNPENA